jgi:hypothetical protein
VNIGRHGEVCIEVARAIEARGRRSIRERGQHPAVDAAFEKPADIVGERHRENRQARFRAVDVHLHALVHGRQV